MIIHYNSARRSVEVYDKKLCTGEKRIRRNDLATLHTSRYTDVLKTK